MKETVGNLEEEKKRRKKGPKYLRQMPWSNL